MPTSIASIFCPISATINAANRPACRPPICETILSTNCGAIGAAVLSAYSASIAAAYVSSIRSTQCTAKFCPVFLTKQAAFKPAKLHTNCSPHYTAIPATYRTTNTPALKPPLSATSRSTIFSTISTAIVAAISIPHYPTVGTTILSANQYSESST